MKRFKFLSSSLALLALLPTSVQAQLALMRPVPKEEVLRIAQQQFPGQDVDYYLIDDNNSTSWNVFVDAEPMKGWQHNCYFVTYPKSVKTDVFTAPIVTSVKTVPQANLVPLLVKNRYGNNAKSKPRVRKQNATNLSNDAAKRCYAVILSGGVNKVFNYERYWNDCSFIYQTLVNKYNVPKENIFPLMSDGTNPAEDMNCFADGFKSQPLDLDFDGVDDIRLAATKNNVRATLSTLAGKLQQDDQLFLFVIDHGGSDDEQTQSYICLWNNERLYDAELANMLTPFTQKLVNVNVVLGQCYAGGFIDNLEKTGCVVAAAAQGSEPSWSCTDIPYDEFVYQWTCAVNGATHTGAPINADEDANGRLTMEEAFNYAEANDRASREHPQYQSTPLSVGEDLAFDHIVPAVDLYIPDNLLDTGKEPNTTTQEYWKSPYIWVRNNPDDIYEFENPIYTKEHQVAYVYTRIFNRGKERYKGGNKYLALYYADAATYIDQSTWKGCDTKENGELKGHYINTFSIKPIEAGGYIDMEMAWPLPNEPKGRYCLLARVMDVPHDDGFVDGKIYFDALGMNDEAQKNLTMIRKTDLGDVVDIIVRNPYDHTSAYSFELIPETPQDAKLYSAAKVEMILGSKVNAAWVEGGQLSQDIVIPAYQPNKPLRVVNLVSQKSQLQNVLLKGKEEDVVQLKFAFNQGIVSNTPFTFDLIQKDKDGNIVGGETFVVEPPSTTGTVIITPKPLAAGRYQLAVDANGANNVNWMDANGETIGNQEAVVVTPTANNHEYTAVATTDEGDLATGTISIEKNNGIQSVSKTTANQLQVELKAGAPEQATLTVASATGGEVQTSCTVPTDAQRVTIDVPHLVSGVYVVSYSVNSTIIDQKKIKVE